MVFQARSVLPDHVRRRRAVQRPLRPCTRRRAEPPAREGGDRSRWRWVDAHARVAGVAGVFDPAAALGEVDSHLDAADEILERMPRHHAVTRFGVEVVRALSRLEALAAAGLGIRSREGGIGDAPSPKIDASAGALGSSRLLVEPDGLRASAEDAERAGLVGAAAALRSAADTIERLRREALAEEAVGAPPASAPSSAGAADLGNTGRGEAAPAGPSRDLSLALSYRLQAADDLAAVTFEYIQAVEEAAREVGIDPEGLAGTATEYMALRAARGVYHDRARAHARAVAREVTESIEGIEDFKSPPSPWFPYPLVEDASLPPGTIEFRLGGTSHRFKVADGDEAEVAYPPVSRETPSDRQGERESAVSPEYTRRVYEKHAERESTHRPLAATAALADAPERPGEDTERCTCGDGSAEEDRGAVLRCPVHGRPPGAGMPQAPPTVPPVSAPLLGPRQDIPFGVVAAIKQPPCPECGEPMQARDRPAEKVWACANGHPLVWCPRIPPPLPDDWRCCECGEENSGAWPECIVCGRARDATPFDPPVEAVSTQYVTIEEDEQAAGSKGQCDEPPLPGSAPSPADPPAPGSAEQYRRWCEEAHTALARAVKRISGLKFNAGLANRHLARSIRRSEDLETALATAIDYIARNVKPRSPGVEHIERSLTAILNARPTIGLPEPWKETLPAAFGIWRRECLRAAREVAVSLAEADEDDVSPGDMRALVDRLAPTATALVSLLELEHGCNEPDETPVDEAMTILDQRLRQDP
jgi:hypothetical protein